jgi:hypothetical protein
MKAKFSKIKINVFIDVSTAADLFYPLWLVFFSAVIFLMPYIGAKLFTELFSTLFKTDAHSQGCN